MGLSAGSEPVRTKQKLWHALGGKAIKQMLAHINAFYKPVNKALRHDSAEEFHLKPI